MTKQFYNIVEHFKIQPISLTNRAIVDMEFEKYGEAIITEELLHEINRKVITAKLDINAINLNTIIVNAPANWIEAIKERFAPKWFLAKYPVKHLEIKVDILAVAEKFKKLPKGDNFVTIMCNKSYYFKEE